MIKDYSAAKGGECQKGWDIGCQTLKNSGETLLGGEIFCCALKEFG